MAHWKMAEAKQELSRVVRSATEEPQWIQNRDVVVAVVLGAKDAELFLEWKKRKEEETLSAALDELSELTQKQRYSLDVPTRVNRENLFGSERQPARHRKRRAR